MCSRKDIRYDASERLCANADDRFNCSSLYFSLCSSRYVRFWVCYLNWTKRKKNIRVPEHFPVTGAVCTGRVLLPTSLWFIPAHISTFGHKEISSHRKSKSQRTAVTLYVIVCTISGKCRFVVLNYTSTNQIISTLHVQKNKWGHGLMESGQTKVLKKREHIAGNKVPVSKILILIFF